MFNYKSVTMKTIILLLLFCIFFVAGKNIEKKVNCEGVEVHNKFHKKEVLGRGLNRPYQLAYASFDHTLFFSYNFGKDDEDTFRIGYIQRNHTGHKELPAVTNGFALAVDNEKHVAYFGGSEGIYRYNLKKENSDPKLFIHDYDIWDMFFKKQLYFISYPEQHLYKVNVREDKDNKPKRVNHIHDKIYQYAIDKYEHQYFTTESGVHMLKNNSDTPVTLTGPKVLRAIEINSKGKAYFCGENGIFVVSEKDDKLEEIAHIKNIFGLAFDHDDNIVYSDPHEIVKLVPEECK